jgi:uncharacterized protein
MNTKLTLRWVATATITLAALGAAAQDVAPGAKPKSDSAGPALSSPIPGQGPGFHDPRSPFKPIVARDGVVPWQMLSSVTTKTEKNRIVPIFPLPVQALNNQTVKLEGFMMPLEPGEKQRHFLLSSVPTTCSFCVPAGPEGLVEVRSRTPVKYSLEPVLLEGRLAVLSNDPYGLFYRIVDAQPIQP